MEGLPIQISIYYRPEGTTQAPTGRKQPTVLPSHDAQELQQRPAWHKSPKSEIAAGMPWQRPTALWLDSRLTQQEGNHAWYWKGSILSRANSQIEHGEEPTTTTSLTQNNSYLHSKYGSLGPQISIDFTLTKEISLCNRQWPLQKTISDLNAENHW